MDARSVAKLEYLDDIRTECKYQIVHDFSQVCGILAMKKNKQWAVALPPKLEVGNVIKTLLVKRKWRVAPLKTL